MITEPATYLAPTAVTDRASGEPVESWASPREVGTYGVLVEPVHDGEGDETYRQASIIGYRLYHPDATVSVSERWRVRVRGEVLAVAGHPAIWRAPWSGRVGTVVEARWVSG